MMDMETTEFEFMQSVEIAELSAALCKAQGTMTGAVKDSTNPFFRSKYADLSAVWDDIRKPFSDNGLSVIQMPTGGGGDISIVTQISHNSGQWIRCKLTMTPVKISKSQDGEIKESATKDPQSVGSCITYARRYSLAAMAGVYQIDDDGNAASKGNKIDDSVHVDEVKIQGLAKDARDVVDLDDEESGPSAARSLYEPLSSDERIRLQAVMKGSAPEGCKKTYWSIFHDHLKRAAK